MELVGTTPEGYGLYRKKDEVGGYDYYTDEVAGLHIWSTSLVNEGSLLAAIVAERARQIKAAYDRENNPPKE